MLADCSDECVVAGSKCSDLSRADVEDWLSERFICDLCKQTMLKRNNAPLRWDLISPTSHYYDETPDVLKQLNTAERRIINIVSVAQDLHMLRSNQQYGIRGCVVIAPREDPVLDALLMKDGIDDCMVRTEKGATLLGSPAPSHLCLSSFCLPKPCFHLRST